MTGPPTILVAESSATHGRPGEDKAHNVQAINRTHSELVKYRRGDQDYLVVLDLLRVFAASAVEVIQTRFRRYRTPLEAFFQC